MIKAKLIFGTYNTQPPGEKTSLVEEYYQKAYKTFLTTLYNFSDISLSLYYGGALLEWFEKEHPEFLSVLSEMVSNKQVELLGGGFYDPALTLISSTDRVGQMEALTTYIRKQFGKKPRGCFLSESVWDSSLIPSLKSCGFDYVYLDENQFMSAGISEDKLFKPIITEDQGKIVTALPVSSSLTRMLFVESPSKVIEYIRDNSHKDGVFTIMYKGEYLKSINKPVSEIKKWLEDFLNLLRANSSWIETVNPSKYVKQIQGTLDRAYFPQYSINGMRYKPLPIVSQRELNRLNKHLGALGDVSHWINSGFFKQFLARYEDSSLIYSKMIYINLLANQIKGDKSKKKSAREIIWKAQSHFVYWHGAHLGIYDRDLRNKTYSYLLDAEKFTREKGIFKSGIHYYDIDMNGKKEALFQSDIYNAYVSETGGVMFELDWFKSLKNLASTVQRKEEAYHSISDDKIGIDKYSRKLFHDHFVESSLKIKDFKTQNFDELGSFVDSVYNLDKLNRDSKIASYNVKGEVKTGSFLSSVILNKKFKFNKNSMILTYTIENLEDTNFQSTFAPEFNLSLDEDNEITKASYSDGSGGQIISKDIVGKDIDSLLVEDKDVKISLSFSEKTSKFITVPQYSQSMDQGDVKNIYQFTSFLPMWNIKIPPKGSWTLSINFSIK